MAIPRLRTEDGNSYCSSCNSQIEGMAVSCPNCGKVFEGEKEASCCPFCGAANVSGSVTCLRCGRIVNSKSVTQISPAHIDQKNESIPTQGETQVEPAPKADVDRKRKQEKEIEEAKRRTQSLWELSEPFEKVIRSRRRRLSKINSLLERAKERMAELEDSQTEEDIKEREKLKEQIEEIMEEKEEIIRIEEGIAEMERIYRNLLALQEAELEKKQEALKFRLHSFEREIERRDKERDKLRSREEALRSRERELQARIKEMEHRESILLNREKELKEKMRMLRKEELEIMKRKFVGESSMPPTQKGWVERKGGIKPEFIEMDLEGDVRGTGKDVKELNQRIAQLEEEIQRISAEKEKLRDLNRTITENRADVRKVLKILDNLLEKLPDEDIKRFADSEDFKVYEKVLEEFEL